MGILGAGFISDYHLQVLRTLPTVQVTAICDTDANRAVAAQRRWRVPRATISLQELLDQANLDVVHVLVPPPLHAAAASVCLEHGCDVFVEKPLATSAAECRVLQAVARRNGRTVGVNHNAIFQPAFLQLLAAIRGRRLGEIQHVVRCWNVPLPQLASRRYDHWIFAAAGNIILEQAVHPLSQIQLLLGRIQSVSTLRSPPIELPSGQPFFNAWQLGLRCERGTAQCFLGFGPGFHQDWLHVVGQDGAAFLDLRRNLFRLTEKSRYLPPLDDLLDGLQTSATLGVQVARNARDDLLGFLRPGSRRDPFYLSMRASIAAFYEALASGQTSPLGLIDGSLLIEACEMIIHGSPDACSDVAVRR